MRFAILVLSVLLVPATRLLAEGTVTLLLGDGQRVTGELASYEPGRVEIRDSSGRRSPVPFGDVVLMDFVGDARSAADAELRALRAAGSDALVVMRRGGPVRGRITDFVSEGGPDRRVVVDVTGGGRQELRLDQVGRIYLRQLTPQALDALGVRPQATPQPLPAPVPAGGLRLPGTQGWIDTGLDVRRGDRVRLQASGRIFLRGDDLEAGPAGTLDGSRAGDAPLPDLPAGALIGRIGRGAPFGVGNQQLLTMPEDGRLYLGINDGLLSDNRGEFTIRVSRDR